MEVLRIVSGLIFFGLFLLFLVIDIAVIRIGRVRTETTETRLDFRNLSEDKGKEGQSKLS